MEHPVGTVLKRTLSQGAWTVAIRRKEGWRYVGSVDFANDLTDPPAGDHWEVLT